MTVSQNDGMGETGRGILTYLHDRVKQNSNIHSDDVSSIIRETISPLTIVKGFDT